MATVDKDFAERLIAGNGWIGEDDHDAPDNPRCIRITKYLNTWGGESYGCVFADEIDIDRYSNPSTYVRNPSIYWEPTA